jgi:hypothetical protein
MEMKKLGLMKDISKLDSFQQFIENQSPKQSRDSSFNSYHSSNISGDETIQQFKEHDTSKVNKSF